MMLSRMALRRTLGLASEVVANASSFHTTPLAAAAAAAGKSPLGQLRKQTGYSLSLCKKALAETQQDVDKAKAWLDERAQAEGWNKANKLEGRNTSQGLIGLQTTKCGTAAAMVELNSETDFVARNKVFHVLLNSVVQVCLARAQSISPAAAASGEADEAVSVSEVTKEALSSIPTDDGKTLGDLVALNIGQIGENIILRRAVLFKTTQDQMRLAGLTHPFSAANVDDVAYGRFGSVVAYSKDTTNKKVMTQAVEPLVKQICQHVIGMNPAVIGDPNVEPVMEPKKEKLNIEEPKGEGEMPDEDWSQYDDQALSVNTNELVHQPFLANTSLSVKDVLLEAGLEVRHFARYEVGESDKQ